MHYYENIQTKYDIFNKLKTTHKGDLDSKLSDIRFQGAMFYVDRYNIPLSFSNENFYSLNGGLWLLDNFIYLNDKSLGPIIFSKDNIDEIMIKDVIDLIYIGYQISDDIYFL